MAKRVIRYFSVQFKTRGARPLLLKLEDMVFFWFGSRMLMIKRRMYEYLQVTVWWERTNDPDASLRYFSPHNQLRQKKEYSIYLKLLQATENWVCLHSLALADHSYKRYGEIDFLMLTRKGIFVLEVKGGRVSRKDGLWTFINRYGQSNVKKKVHLNRPRAPCFLWRGQ